MSGPAAEAGRGAWRIPAASAAGIVRSGPGADRDVRGRGDRNGSFVGGRRHRREQGTADLPGGRRVAATNRPAPAARLAGGRRGRGSSGSPAPLRGWEANARPRPADLPGPAGRHRAAGPGRARAGPDHDGHPVRRGRHLVAGWREHGRGRPADLYLYAHADVRQPAAKRVFRIHQRYS